MDIIYGVFVEESNLRKKDLHKYKNSYNEITSKQILRLALEFANLSSNNLSKANQSVYLNSKHFFYAIYTSCKTNSSFYIRKIEEILKILTITTRV